MEVRRTERSDTPAELTVDELVLHGVDALDAPRIAEAMRLELGRLIAADPAIADRIAGGGEERIAPPLRIEYGTQPGELGVLLARTILGEVAP